MVTRPLIPGAISTFTCASRAKANNSSVTGTSLTTTVYLSSCCSGKGSGTGGGCRTISGISPDWLVAVATERCPVEGNGGSGVNFAQAAQKLKKTTQRRTRLCVALLSITLPMAEQYPVKDRRSMHIQIQCNNSMMLLFPTSPS